MVQMPLVLGPFSNEVSLVLGSAWFRLLCKKTARRRSPPYSRPRSWDCPSALDQTIITGQELSEPIASRHFTDPRVARKNRVSEWLHDPAGYIEAMLRRLSSSSGACCPQRVGCLVARAPRGRHFSAAACNARTGPRAPLVHRVAVRAQPSSCSSELQGDAGDR